MLKGDDTIVAEPDGRVAVSPGASPGLATAGTGDVLSGVSGAMLAKGMDPFTAAWPRCRLHAAAGSRAAAARGADGMIARDVIEALPFALPAADRRAGPVGSRVVATVGDIMERDPVTVSPGDEVEKVIRVLRENELPGIPVVNSGGRLVGIVTENDLILRDDAADLHLPHHLDIMGGVIYLESMKHFEARVKKAFASNVEDMMTSDPITVEPSAPLEDAAKLIAEHKHNRLPVVEHGRLVGVITRLDVLDALTSE